MNSRLRQPKPIQYPNSWSLAYINVIDESRLRAMRQFRREISSRTFDDQAVLLQR